MATPTQFRHYLISQDADGSNIEIARSSDQVGVLAFDSRRLEFVHCHVLLEPLKDSQGFESRARKLGESGHPLLARLLDFGDDEGSTFYITENVDGETLRSYFSRHAELPVWLAAKLTDLALAAFRALAERGDYVPLQPLDALRVLQTGPRDLRIEMADFRLAEAANEITLRNRQSKSAHEKQARFISDFLKEQAPELKTPSAAGVLSRADFSEVLVNLLLSCGPETARAIGALRKSLASFCPAQPPGDLPANLKPRPLIGPLLASFQEVARSVSQTVRLQSQKLDAGQPYALRGTLMKSGQPIVVEQVPPARLTGIAPGEALRQARNLPKTGKFPNLVPLLFVEENERLECAGETAVEGVTLGDVLSVRGTLEVPEIHLVLTGVDAALGQLEKAARAMRRLRLEDIFLFTGLGKSSVMESRLLDTRLTDWPGFSIVLRGHPCLHAMSGRGSDPGLLLPVELPAKDQDESPWNGGWLAALATWLSGKASDAAAPPRGAGEEHIARLFEDELESAAKGTAGTRGAFLARMARIMDQHDLVPAKGGGFGQQLSASAAAPVRPAQVARADAGIAPAKPAVPPSPAPALAPREMGEPEPHPIGFAEALIHAPAALERRDSGGAGRLLGGEFQNDPLESSWTGFHQEKPVWMRVTAFAAGAMAAGALLAQLQGRALWQGRKAVESPPPPALSTKPAPTAETRPPATLPVKEAKASVPKLAPPQKPILADLSRDAPSGEAIPAPKAVPVPGPLIERLRQIRLSGTKLPDEWRAETESAAKSGVTEAMIALGNALLRGAGGTIDEQAAFGWFEKAAQAGDNAAVVSLAGCYLQGWGTAPNFPQAVTLLNRAATNGESSAKDLLGVCYARGLGVARDDAKAFELVRQAHQEGVPSACGNLGSMYLRGQGVAADPARAAELFAEGARKGHAESMLLYARSLENGIGAPADSAAASRWYQEAARLGNAEAAAWCLRKGITPSP
jgi:hypothetical protein